MVTYFSETDLISFANFCLSDTRRLIYLEQGISEEKIDDLLNTVNPADIKHWFNIIVKQRQEDNRKITETPEPNEN